MVRSLPAMLLLVVVLAMLTSDHTVAQGEEEAAIDEIVVEAKKTRSHLLSEIRHAEDRVYDLFNEINTEDGYDIICRRVTRVGSQIVRRECKARMFYEERSRLTEEAPESGRLASGNIVNKQEHAEKLSELMVKVAKENPEFVEELRKLRSLKDELEASQ